MRRAVIYSRFSTDLQNDKSIAHQEAVARAFAARSGFEIVGCYSDAAMSGASVFGRDGLLSMLADAKAQKFDVIVVEELDRLSRDMEDLAGIHKRMTFCGIDIVAIHEGKANTVTIGLRGLVGQLFREDNVHKTKRGMAGKIQAGLLAGGKPYGYSLDPANKGKASIIEDEAVIIRRIYQEYIEGTSPRAIAHKLNAEGVPGPRGGPWQSSAIYGWPRRGTGILRNPIYDGRIVWNKMRFIKDPDTGRRVSRANPPEEWKTADAPELRIVSAEVFAKAQALCGASTKTAAECATMKRPKRLLSGLLKCAGCGGGMSVVSKDKSGRERIVCTAHRERRACPAPKTFYLDRIEAAVVDTLRQHLRAPELLAEYVKTYNETRLELAREARRSRSTLERRIAALDGECHRMTELLVTRVGDESRLGARLNAKEAELKALKRELALEPEPIDVVALHPEALAAYERSLHNLQRELNDSGTLNAKLAGCIRELVQTITVAPDADRRGGILLSIQGKLRALIGDCAPTPEVWGTLVAGAGFEPTTFRL